MCSELSVLLEPLLDLVAVTRKPLGIAADILDRLAHGPLHLRQLLAGVELFHLGSPVSYTHLTLPTKA